MASHNRIIITGLMADDPDVKATTSGHSLSKFTLRVPRIDSNGPTQRFDFIRVTAWRENADATAAFKKNDALYVEGRILTDSYEDSAGQRKWTTEVEAKQLTRINDVLSASTTDSSTPPILPKDRSSDPVLAQDEIQPIEAPSISESDFFSQSNETDSENELDEDVPF